MLAQIFGCGGDVRVCWIETCPLPEQSKERNRIYVKSKIFIVITESKLEINKMLWGEGGGATFFFNQTIPYIYIYR